MRLTLNLAQRGEASRGWPRVALWAAGSLLVAVLTGAHLIHYRSVAGSVALDEVRLRALEAEAKGLEARHARGLPGETREALAALPARLEAYNRIIAATAFSWTGLLMELEESLPPNVGLTAIHPDPASGTVTLEGAARGLADIEAFLTLLGQRPVFRDAFLMRHNEQGRGGAEGPRLQDFTIKLIYEAAG